MCYGGKVSTSIAAACKPATLQLEAAMISNLSSHSHAARLSEHDEPLKQSCLYCDASWLLVKLNSVMCILG